jgi:RNA polymerase sigma factor (sigma-70 family)
VLFNLRLGGRLWSGLGERSVSFLTNPLQAPQKKQTNPGPLAPSWSHSRIEGRNASDLHRSHTLEPPVTETTPSLLERVQQHPEDHEAWRLFHDLYRPLLASWIRRYSIQDQDCDDILQDIFQILLRELPHFHYDPAKGHFRSWLRSVMVNRLREYGRSKKTRPVTGDGDTYDKILLQLVDEKSDLARQWDREHNKHLAQRLLSLIEPDFSATTWQAFRRVMEGEQAAQVAADLKISVNAVIQAKCRVLKRLRHEMAGLAK